MQGVLYVIEELGQGLAQLKAENAALREENARLRAEQAEPREDQSPAS